MKNEKERHTVWLDNSVWNIVKDHYRADNCTTQNEYIEKAIRFYTGYLDAQNADAYLPRVLAQLWEGQLDMLGDHVGKLLFKAAVEQDICNHILAADTDIDQETLDRLRGRCVREVKESNGRISFKDALQFQNLYS